MQKLLLLLAFLMSGIVQSAQATSYFVSNSGNDAHTGTSTTQAWRSIDRVNQAVLRPGDQVFFAGGQQFAGSIWLKGSTQGTAQCPIRLGSYGAGWATINSGTSYGLYAHNSAGLVVSRLRFAGSGRLSSKSSGVIFYLDSADTHLSYLRLDSLEVSGYQQTGISVGSWQGTSGYTDVRITNCRAHDNGEAGISSYSQDLGAHHDWYVANCQAYNNSGRADITTTHTGNGIVLSGIDGALIERCEAYNNGWLNANPRGGPVGIWGWCCNNLVIQECESHHNRSGIAHDGGGFDLDGGCTNSVLQYNYSHDNDGPGYLLAQYPDAPPLRDVTIRYNISANDARRYNQGAIMLWSSGANGGIQRASIHNNTVYLDAPDNGSRPKALYISSDGISDITLRNNIFQTTGGLAVVESAVTSGVRLEGNCYWSSKAAFLLQWGGTAFTSLSEWRTKTGQEMIGSRVCGLEADPNLVQSDRSSPKPTAATDAFRLMAVSPLIGSGLDLRAEFGWQPGPRDYYRNSTPAPGTRGNIGAAESRSVTLGSQTTSLERAEWFIAYPTIVHEQVQVEVKARVAGLTTLRLYDLRGRQCLVQQLPTVALSRASLSLAGLPAGRYILQASQGANRATQPLIIE